MTPEQAAAEAYAEAQMRDDANPLLKIYCAADFSAGIAWARKQTETFWFGGRDKRIAELEEKLRQVRQEWDDATERTNRDIDDRMARIKELEAQVANWERKEVRKASCCVDNEERVKELEAENASLRDAWPAHSLITD